MKMYRILLIFLATVLFCSVAEALLDGNSEQTVNVICKQTIDTTFCRSVFAKKLNTPSPSKKDLLNVTVAEAQRFSANTYFFISTLLRDAGDEKPRLQMCAEAYAIVNTAFTNAVSFFNQGIYNKILKLKDDVSTGVSICKTDFSVSGYKINPMIKKNREALVFTAMENIIGQMAS
ncbi:unnamed protein product [Thlaspi arvense]|uniref:Pectinesterase inhibitor domain-containing protein n=1 Tax=Thlaspi arvense TaxID=13288 RepID=A0AAU9RDB5_THLAR|nr:unnamed protein product [Thlaspi arvense]